MAGYILFGIVEAVIGVTQGRAVNKMVVIYKRSCIFRYRLKRYSAPIFIIARRFPADAQHLHRLLLLSCGQKQSSHHVIHHWPFAIRRPAAALFPPGQS